MQELRAETTIQGPCSLSGRGYWSGKLNTLTFQPAEAGHGIQMQRLDLPNSRPVVAVAENCVGMSLRTRLTDGWAEFDMVEHVMSAAYGLGIDNLLVQCTASEMPAFDGSSHAIALALSNSGLVHLDGTRRVFSVDRAVSVGDCDRYVRFEPTPELDELQVEYQLDYGDNHPISVQSFAMTLRRDAVGREFYLREVAPARTFVTTEEAQRLQQAGIAQHVTERDLLVFGQDGPLQNELRFSNECARHKALDLLGDLAVTGVDLQGKLIARKSGHQLNGELADLLRGMVSKSNNASQKHVA